MRTTRTIASKRIIGKPVDDQIHSRGPNILKTENHVHFGQVNLINLDKVKKQLNVRMPASNIAQSALIHRASFNEDLKYPNVGTPLIQGIKIHSNQLSSKETTLLKNCRNTKMINNGKKATRNALGSSR